MQQYAVIYLLRVYMFRVSIAPIIRSTKNVTAASGAGYSNGATTFLQRGLIRPRWRKVFAPLLWPVPEAAFTFFVLLMMGVMDARNV